MNPFVNSTAFYQRSQKILAGPSTFGKGADLFAHGITPYAIERGEGAYLWDVDNNQYLDTMSAMGAVLLGYRHPYLDEAIGKQLKQGVSISLPHTLEVEVAEMLCERIPCAEMVRFGKNGNDVTSAAVRLARYVSGNNHILFCGYHGWQDWYVCQTSMNGGILNEVQDYSHRFKYNNLEDLENFLVQFKNQVSCIIMEAVSRIEPEDGYLQGVRDLADKHDVILIFDEVVTGFRFDRGGYQKVCGVTPDLGCFSKGMGNGMPISALVGKRDIMEHCPEIFYSLTFAGETLSLAATKAVMEVIDREDVPAALEQNGNRLLNGLKQLSSSIELEDIMDTQGFPCRSVLYFKDYNGISATDIHTYFIQELSKIGVLTTGVNILSLAHTETVIDTLLERYSAVLKSMKSSLDDESLPQKLLCPSVKPSARDL